MNAHEITVLAAQVDKMHERTLTLEAQVAGILKLFAEPKLAELLGPSNWQRAPRELHCGSRSTPRPLQRPVQTCTGG